VSKHRHTAMKGASYGKIACPASSSPRSASWPPLVYTPACRHRHRRESVTSGTLNLTLTARDLERVQQLHAEDAPRHRQRVRQPQHTGTLATAAGMTLAVVGTPSNALTNGSVAGEGLTLTATQCSSPGPWHRRLLGYDHDDPGHHPGEHAVDGVGAVERPDAGRGHRQLATCSSAWAWSPPRPRPTVSPRSTIQGLTTSLASPSPSSSAPASPQPVVTG